MPSDFLEIRELKARIEQLIQANNDQLDRRRAAERERDCLQRMLVGFCAADMEPHSMQVYASLKLGWSVQTFGPEYPATRILGHIRRELEEIARNPRDRMEWIDVIMLALDGYLRSGHEATPERVMPDLVAKLLECQQREWIDPQNGGPVEHKRD